MASLSLKKLKADIMVYLRPPEKMEVWEFCDRYRVLSPETAESPGPWRTEIVPYTKEPMQIFENIDVKRIVLKWAIQLAKTEILLNLLMWTFVRRPGSTLVVFPKKKTATDEFSKKRLDPMIRDSKILNDIFPKFNRDYINTAENKVFVGGTIRMSGTDATDLASTPVRYLFIDEASRCAASAGNEGNVFDLAEGRTSNFFDSKAVYVSSPTEEGVCHISNLHDETRQYVYLVPCPRCEEMIELEWENMLWDNDDPQTTRYSCQACKEEIKDREKHDMLKRGRWHCLNPEKSMEAVGFHLSGLYSPFRSWSKLVSQYIEARNALNKGDEEKMKVFVNTRLARAYSPKTEGIDANTLFQRLEPYRSEVPEGVLFITAGADVNGDHIAIEVVGWGPNHESWSIDYQRFWGDTKQNPVWEAFESYLLKPWRHEWGFNLTIDALAIDQGFLSKIVEAFVKKHQGRKFYAVKGERGWNRPIVDQPYRKRRGKGGRLVPLFPVCDNEAKTKIYSDLRRERGENGCHFPLIQDKTKLNPYGLEYFRELTSERIKTKYVRGFPRREFVKPDHIRNEPLDCRKYALAARIIANPIYPVLKIRFERMRDEVKAMIDDGLSPDEAASQFVKGRSIRAKKTSRPSKSHSWVNRW
ncbi:MAG: phage terminase large subunit family protein [Oligoflexus sp.]